MVSQLVWSSSALGLLGDVRDFGDVDYVYYVVLEVRTHAPYKTHELVSLRHLIHGLNECAEYPGSILIPVRQQTRTIAPHRDRDGCQRFANRPLGPD